MVRDLREAYPDFQMTIVDIISEGDRVAARLVGSGTHRDTGRRIEIPGNTFWRIADGKVVEFWPVADTLRWVKQLGLVPEDL